MADDRAKESEGYRRSSGRHRDVWRNIKGDYFRGAKSKVERNQPDAAPQAEAGRQPLRGKAGMPTRRMMALCRIFRLP
jgi:hypothetical protein